MGLGEESNHRMARKPVLEFSKQYIYGGQEPSRNRVVVPAVLSLAELVPCNLFLGFSKVKQRQPSLMREQVAGRVGGRISGLMAQTFFQLRPSPTTAKQHCLLLLCKYSLTLTVRNHQLKIKIPNKLLKFSCRNKIFSLQECGGE